MEKTGTPEWYARRAWTKISLGNIARPANGDEVVREMAPFFKEAMDASAEAVWADVLGEDEEE